MIFKKIISAEKLKSMLDGEEQVVVLDVRGDKEFDEEHIMHANFAPWAADSRNVSTAV